MLTAQIYTIKFFDKVGSLTAPVIDAEKLIWDKVLQ
ncbi:hypothetical protein CASFOL_030395 [Castilleja foliolosa]|uniref:Uncharacterized protein n=1 Tax=Castilleja foliolosa TaxID=1961234 RepID=A0ABD3C7V4_9LAMI